MAEQVVMGSGNEAACRHMWKDLELTSPAREGQTLAGESLLVRYANFVKLPHTVFALPFALLGVLVASRETALTWRTLVLVVLAFTCARFVALGSTASRTASWTQRNPRTRGGSCRRDGSGCGRRGSPSCSRRPYSSRRRGR